MNSANLEVQPEQLLTAIHKQLQMLFFQKTKHTAKNLYQAIEAGRKIPFMRITTQDEGNVSFELSLDHSKFDGRLSFSSFRNALASHLTRTASKLAKKESLNIFTNDASCDMIFHIPGIVETGNKLNVLVTGVRQTEGGVLSVRLLFLDPAQFSADAATTPE